MRSTFMGLETNKRGLYTQQSALYTTGHNISNANTLGYSRQRVNMQATAGHPGVGLNSGTIPGFLGTGVEAGSIQRIRDSFVDHQFRQESNKLGYWESRSQAISQMEDVLNEPSHYGLQKSLSLFWQSLQDLAVNPENAGARAVAVQNGVDVADSFNYMHKSLTQIQTNIGTEIEVSTKDINSLLQQIADLNRQISQVEPNGYMPNDLYDARDILLDELSIYVPIEIEYEKSGGRALAIAEGSVTVTLKSGHNETLTLVEGNKSAKLEIEYAASNNGENAPVKELSISGIDNENKVSHGELLDVGKLKSLMNSYGTDDGNGLYPDMLASLNKMAKAFAEEFNSVHADGYPKEGGKTDSTNEFFVKGNSDAEFTAANIKVNDSIVENPNSLRASSEQGEEGNGTNAQKLSEVQSKNISELGGTVETFFQQIIGELGVSGLQAEKLKTNNRTLLGAVEHRRASISSVSLDEEMTDMIRFQQAYNASARMITVIDETLDKIINGMGRVGM